MSGLSQPQIGGSRAADEAVRFAPVAGLAQWRRSALQRGSRVISQGANGVKTGVYAMNIVKTLTLVVGLSAASLGAAEAQNVALNQERHINDSLRAGRIGDVIRKSCPTIDARMFTVWRKLEDLKRYALDKGYSETEVRAFLKDEKEKTRLKREADDWLKRAGAVKGDKESYCRVGRDQIAKKTLVGSLLRSRS